MEIEKLQEKLNHHLDGIRLVLNELRTYDSDIKKLMAIHQVEILTFPSEKVFRLRDERGRGGYSSPMIRTEKELSFSIEEIIEEVTIEKVWFGRNRYDDETDKPFRVFYDTSGYYEHNNQYENENFGEIIFKSKIELIEKLSPDFEKAKADFIEKQKTDKENKKRQLASQLEELSKEENKNT